MFCVFFIACVAIIGLLLPASSSIGMYCNALLSNNSELNNLFFKLLAISFFCSTFAFVPIFEKIAAWFQWEQPAVTELHRIKPLFTDILSRYNKKFNASKSYDKFIIKINLHDNNEINACAFGRSTIVINKATLDKLSDKQLSGVLAHELGHIHCKHTLIGMAAFYSLLLSTIVSKLVGGIMIMASGITKTGCILTIILLPTILFYNVFVFLNNILIKLTDYAILFQSRHSEYQADTFAVTIGLGQELKDVLKIMSVDEIVGKNFLVRWWEQIHSTHPLTLRRIARIEKQIQVIQPTN
jgi:Zn-dependent protease with chaperone function